MTTPSTPQEPAQEKPQVLFPNFYGNPVIEAMGQAARWTISGNLPDRDSGVSKGKAPIDLRELLDRGRIRGCWSTEDGVCAVSLEELTTRIPNAANNAFYLRAQTDGLMVIDIEPKCPPEIAAALLRLPGILYYEISMSGNGYHLVAPLPQNFWQHPIAAGKTVLKHAEGWYEILLEHWVTFTRRPITRMPGATPDPEVPGTVEQLFEALAVKAVQTASSTSVHIEAAEAPDIAFRDEIVEAVTAEGLPKSIDDFDHDASRWEFSSLAVLYKRVRSQTVVRESIPPELGGVSEPYSDSDQAWLLYLSASMLIPYRPKHNETRNGRPFLLDRAASLVAERKAARERARAEVAEANG